MNKSELIEALAQDIGIPHREAAATREPGRGLGRRVEPPGQVGVVAVVAQRLPIR